MRWAVLTLEDTLLVSSSICRGIGECYYDYYDYIPQPRDAVLWKGTLSYWAVACGLWRCPTAQRRPPTAHRASASGQPISPTLRRFYVASRLQVVVVVVVAFAAQDGFASFGQADGLSPFPLSPVTLSGLTGG